MQYYSIENYILVAYSKEFNYVATLMPSIGVLRSGKADENTLVLGLIIPINEVDPKTFQEFIAKPENSKDAEEITTYWKTIENIKS